MQVIVCGVGNIAFRVIELFQKIGETVTVIALSKDEGYIKNISAKKTRLVAGDARDRETLIKAGIKKADAFLALTGEEIINIEISIIARELNPNIRIITRMFDENFSKKIQKGFKINKTLSTSALASSSFVSACMNDSILHSFDFEGAINYIVDLQIGENSLLLDMAPADVESLYPVKIIMHHKNGKAKKTMPDKLGQSDRILYATFDKNVIAKLDPRKKHTAGFEDFVIDKADLNPVKKIKKIPGNIKLIGVAYFTLIITAVIIFHIGMKLSVIDAIYFVITTTTTIGYGDFNLQNAPVWVKIFGCFVMLGGAALLASIFSVITDALISRRFNQYFGLGKSRMRNHVIIAGIGNIGYRVLNLLHDGGEKIIAVEKDPASPFLSSLRGKVPVIFGDALYTDTIRVTNIKKAATVMALTDDDLTNLNILLNAKENNPGIKTIGRIFNRNIREKAESAFGIDTVLSTSYIAAPTFVSAAAHTKTIYSFIRDGEIHSLIEINITDYTFLQGLNAADIIKRYNLFPFLYKKSSSHSGLIASGYKTEPEDILTLIGRYEDIKKFPDL